MIACECGHLNVIQLLVEKQANISLKSEVNVIVADALCVSFVHIVCTEGAHMSNGCLPEWLPGHSGILAVSSPG